MPHRWMFVWSFSTLFCSAAPNWQIFWYWIETTSNIVLYTRLVRDQERGIDIRAVPLNVQEHVVCALEHWNAETCAYLDNISAYVCTTVIIVPFTIATSAFHQWRGHRVFGVTVIVCDALPSVEGDLNDIESKYVQCKAIWFAVLARTLSALMNPWW